MEWLKRVSGSAQISVPIEQWASASRKVADGTTRRTTCQVTEIWEARPGPRGKQTASLEAKSSKYNDLLELLQCEAVCLWACLPELSARSRLLIPRCSWTLLLGRDAALAEALTLLSYPFHWTTFVAKAESFLASVQVHPLLEAIGNGTKFCSS